LGDYVNGGDKSIEVVNKISNLKINNKDKIVLLPGNHDVYKDVNPGFQKRLLENTNQGITIMDEYVNTFENAPIAYHNEKYKLLGVHGFIPHKGGQNFKNWKKAKDGKKYTYELLWNDPMLSFDVTHQSSRGIGIKWIGKPDTIKFMNNNNINKIIRSHEPEINETYKINGKEVINVGSSKFYGTRKFYILPEGKIVNTP
jgi:protein phosphatase